MDFDNCIMNRVAAELQVITLSVWSFSMAFSVFVAILFGETAFGHMPYRTTDPLTNSSIMNVVVSIIFLLFLGFLGGFYHTRETCHCGKKESPASKPVGIGC